MCTANSRFGCRFLVLAARQALLLYAALLLQLVTHAQQNKPLVPAQAQAVWQQEIYVHVNKNFFVSGEPLWFSVFNVDAVHRQLTNLEKVAFVELFNARLQPVLQATVPLQKGRGHGGWIIPDTVQTGNYLLRVYTNALKNQGQKAYFETFIAIVNTTQPPAWRELDQPPSPDVQIYPEGGNLVFGIANNTAIRCMDEYGAGIAARGAVINQRNDTVARFVTCCGGRALFNWTPQKEDRYNIVVQPENSPKFQISLPQAHPEGITMAVNKNVSGNIEVSIKGSVQYQNQNLLLVAGNAYALQMQEGSAGLLLSEADMPQGLSNLLLYDTAGKLLAYRPWYRKQTDSLVIGMQLEKNIFKTRQQVQVALSTATSSGQAAAADLSISVFRIDSIQTVGHLGVGKDIDGTLPAELQTAPDLFVRTAGAAWSYSDTNNAAGASIIYLPQYEGPQLLARITDKQSAKPVAGITAYLSIPDRYYQFLSAVSDHAGIVRFNLKNFKDQQKLFVVLDPKQKDYAVKLLPFFDPAPPARVWPRFSLPENRAAQLQEHNLSHQVQAAFNLAPALVGSAAPADTSAFIGLPDKSYLLDDYTRFTTLEEVLREYVPEVLVRKRNNTFHFKVFNQPYGQFFDADPLVLADGVPVFDIDKMMAADPLKIKRLDIITRRYAKGLDVYEGILSFTTYAGNLEGMPLPQEGQVSALSGSLPEKAFRYVQHDGITVGNNRTPDRRLQLCWLPAVQTDANGKQNFSFFTSDIAGVYAIVVRGISANGLAGNTVYYFEVKN